MNVTGILTALYEFAMKKEPFGDLNTACLKYDEARAAIKELDSERDALRVIAQDFDEVMRELSLRCECGEADCRTTRLDAALARVGGES